MMENAYYKCVVKVEYEDAKGKMKSRKEEYVVEAVSPTDVEAKVTKELEGYDFEVAQISLTKILSILR